MRFRAVFGKFVRTSLGTRLRCCLYQRAQEVIVSGYWTALENFELYLERQVRKMMILEEQAVQVLHFLMASGFETRTFNAKAKVFAQLATLSAFPN